MDCGERKRVRKRTAALIALIAPSTTTTTTTPVFDTANIVNGRCYGLDMHLDRLLRSAGLAR